MADRDVRRKVRLAAAPRFGHVARRQAAKAAGREKALGVRYYDWIAHFGRRTPDKIAAIDLGSQRRFTYREFDARIARLASHLRDNLKIARGDRVAVLALNTTDTLE